VRIEFHRATEFTEDPLFRTPLALRQLFGVTPADPLTYAAVVAVLTAASLIACYIPAWRASRVDPMEALRQE
jgi:putative ABC transport system permease protein